jgi:hypothetical protein
VELLPRSLHWILKALMTDWPELVSYQDSFVKDARLPPDIMPMLELLYRRVERLPPDSSPKLFREQQNPAILSIEGFLMDIAIVLKFRDSSGEVLALSESCNRSLGVQFEQNETWSIDGK